MSIRTFKNQGCADLAFGRKSKKARSLVPASLFEVTYLRLLKLDAATSLDDLAMFPSYRLEKLRGNRSGQFSIRINDQYRICFSWKAPDAYEVEVVDYH